MCSVADCSRFSEDMFELAPQLINFPPVAARICEARLTDFIAHVLLRACLEGWQSGRMHRS